MKLVWVLIILALLAIAGLIAFNVYQTVLVTEQVKSVVSTVTDSTEADKARDILNLGLDRLKETVSE